MRFDALNDAVLAGVSSPAGGGVQLQFDRGTLLLLNPFTLKCDSGGLLQPATLIGCRVSSCDWGDCELELVFEGRLYLTVSLREQDFLGPEAAVFQPLTGAPVIFD
jgi:hypothetical protein